MQTGGRRTIGGRFQSVSVSLRGHDIGAFLVRRQRLGLVVWRRHRFCPRHVRNRPVVSADLNAGLRLFPQKHHTEFAQAAARQIRINTFRKTVQKTLQVERIIGVPYVLPVHQFDFL
jgi:hypothetical protein